MIFFPRDFMSHKLKIIIKFKMKYKSLKMHLKIIKKHKNLINYYLKGKKNQRIHQKFKIRLRQ